MDMVASTVVSATVGNDTAVRNDTTSDDNIIDPEERMKQLIDVYQTTAQ